MNATYNTTDTRFNLFGLADAIEAGVIVRGRYASVGTYRTATSREYRVVFHNGITHDVVTDGSRNAAQHFVAIEGEEHAALALNDALLRRDLLTA